MPSGAQGLLAMVGFCAWGPGCGRGGVAAGAGAGVDAGAGADAGAATDVGPAAAGAGAGPQTERETPVLSVAVVITWPAGQLVAGGA
ncbi:MAG: hypothetical protein RIQ43_1227, partial [Pseudomonadota bacterium]